MTHPPSPQSADLFADWVFWVVMFGIGFWRRRRQNEKLAGKIDKSLADRVHDLEELAKELRLAQENGQTRAAILTEKINHLDSTLSAMGVRFDKMEGSLPRVEDVLEKVLNVLERLKAGVLVEKQIAPGVTKITKEGK